MFTAHDARNAKRNADARRFGPAEDSAAILVARQAEIDAFLKANPRIGVIVRKGRAVFYTFEGGYREAANPESLA